MRDIAVTMTIIIRKKRTILTRVQITILMNASKRNGLDKKLKRSRKQNFQFNYRNSSI